MNGTTAHSLIALIDSEHELLGELAALVEREFTEVRSHEANPQVLDEILVEKAALVEALDVATGERLSWLEAHQLPSHGEALKAAMAELDDSGKLRAAKIDSLNKLGHAIHDLDPVFDAFSRPPELAEIVRRLGFEDPGIVQSMYIFKPPRIGGEVVCHQDSTFIYTEPESCVGFWFALEDATLENGCMEFIAGAHRGALRERNYRVAEGGTVTETLDRTPWPEDERVAVPAKKGSLVIFSGRTPHLSGPNRSDKSRHAYTLHVIDQGCHYPAENWLQRSPSMPLRGFD